MNKQNDGQKPIDNMELLKQQAEECGSECCCHAAGSGVRMRWILGAIILVAAAALVARAIMNDKSVSTDKTAAGFAASQIKAQTIPPAAVVEPARSTAPAISDAIAGKEIGAFSELNTIAADSDGVFLFLPGRNETAGKSPAAQIQQAVKTIESKGQKIGVFTLKTGSADYEKLSAQMAGPAVIAMVKGKGTSTASGDITETKLVQAFVAASSAGGCCCGGSASCK
jgi:hypothetical protein